MTEIYICDYCLTSAPLGQIWLLEGEKSLHLLLHQLRQFPNGKHDDPVDSFTQALHVLPRLGSGKAVW